MNLCFWVDEICEKNQEALVDLLRLNKPVFVHENKINKSVIGFLENKKENTSLILTLNCSETKIPQEISIFCHSRALTHVMVVDDLQKTLLDRMDEIVTFCSLKELSVVLFSKPKSQFSKALKSIFDEENIVATSLSTLVYPVEFLKSVSERKATKLYHREILLELLKQGREARVLHVEGFLLKGFVGNFKDKLYKMYLDVILQFFVSINKNSSPFYGAISCAAGAFIACTPFYGLQTLLIFIFCYVFRLSFPIAFIGSQVSLPPTYSLILPLELLVGLKLLGIEQTGDLIDMISGNFYALLVGSLVVGAGIAVSLGALWYLAHRYFLGSRAMKVEY